MARKAQGAFRDPWNFSGVVYRQGKQRIQCLQSMNSLISFFFFFSDKFIFRQPLQTPRAKLYMKESKYLYFYLLRLVPTLMMKMTIGNFFCFTAIKTVYLSLPGFVRFMSTFGLKTQSCTILITTRRANPLLQTCASGFRNL